MQEFMRLLWLIAFDIGVVVLLLLCDVMLPGLLAPRRVSAPVQLVDLLPTVLAGLAIPRPARVRGADLGPLLAGLPPPASACAPAGRPKARIRSPEVACS